VGLIVKSGEDLRQEALGQQLVAQFERLFTVARLPLWLRPCAVSPSLAVLPRSWVAG
jgi:phosphatidylinositol kinase/protein kinase (PI-3  family)